MSKANSSQPFTVGLPSRPSGASSADTVWMPNTDVYLHASGAVIKVELAGIRKEDLEISVEGTRLTMTGVRRDECRNGDCNFQAMEIHYGAFESVVELPAGYDLTQARASYQNGFLRVDVPTVSGARKA
ncbi:MAG: Hsp20/alpha crystallin family protein [Verrucomicrobia bacterium]|nr:Hsp20/alpha crystallin family protein [Verrucomicrobiota bacterium]NBU10595.1 Hsp20/alpha crystallin family protein [Pseudomonadota bacterium]NDA66334.1 Hsp20/alpha crystallin family protein [Verrucomicrobiota bacterium]NDB75240.1 Hsp20/alpha crystallin family protein [Verrucomicrobiota bacterium]NDD38174.1 Hsp20/alpha crystallin family protein [Verrucomicrobiota bacterium]